MFYLPLFESKEDAELRRRIAADVKEKFDAEQLKRKEATIRQQEQAKLESGGLRGAFLKQAKKTLKEAGKSL